MFVPPGWGECEGMSFENLRVYQAAERLDQLVLVLIAMVPRGFGDDIDDLRRACGSILHNIAEAYGSIYPGVKINHLGIARGSADEARSVLRRLVRRGGLPESAIRKPRELIRLIT